MVLARHPDVRDCAVVVRDDLPGGPGLVGYLAPKSGNGRNGRARDLMTDVRSYLQTQLPAYMVPSAFVVLETLPLSPNGKIARGALPRPHSAKADTRATGTLPATATEKALAKLWQELLEIDRVDVDDNFFELGGHSLLAVKLFAQIEKSFSSEASGFNPVPGSHSPQIGRDPFPGAFEPTGEWLGRAAIGAAGATTIHGALG